MATKSAKKQSKNRIDSLRATAQKINDQSLQFSENLVEETIATGAEWQNIFAKALKNGNNILEAQQDFVFSTLEDVKGQYFKGNKRFRKLFSFNLPKEEKVEKVEKVAKKVTKSAPKSNAKARVNKIAKKVSAEDKQLKTIKKAIPTTKVVKSDLKLIEGIGPKLESILNTAGIISFDQLAKANPTKVKAILETAGPRYKMHNPTSWSQQAKLAAVGKMEELKALQAELKGGKAKK